MTQTLKFFKDGRSYEERTYCPMMDGIGYVTDLINAQERPSHVSMRPTNKMFNKFYKVQQPSKKSKLNKLMNDTLKNSSPQFYVEQQFNAIGGYVNNGRYEFKLDPNFMSCNSVYKTLALRGIYMKPKSYVVNYAAMIKITTRTSTETLEPENQPTWCYTNIVSEKYFRKERAYKFEVVITDDKNQQYIVNYEQNYKYKGPEFKDEKDNTLTVLYNGVEYFGRNNHVHGIKGDEGKTIDFEFYPHGYAKITTRYPNKNTTVLECVKIDMWKDNTTTCENVKIIKTIESEEFEYKIPFMITLLPENNIEEFCHMVTREINNYIKNNFSEAQHINQCEVKYDYDSSSNCLIFYVSTDETVSTGLLKFVPIDDKHKLEADKFYRILNQPKTIYDPPYDEYVYYGNVWNREYFFVHASFMNLVQYNQLGRTGEIYPKPTKLTKYTSLIPDIEFWTSVNGIDPFVLFDQDFEVVLALAATLNNADITF